MPRSVPSGLLTHIAANGTSLCNLINVTDALGATLALTDHTENITVSSVTYVSRPGVQVSVLKTQGNMEIDNYEITGFFITGVVTLADVLKGRFTGARVRRYIVNYDSPSSGVLQIGDGNISRVEVRDNQFTCQVLGKMWRLSQPVGRLTTKHCDVIDFGGDRCFFDLNTTHYTTGTAFKQNLTVSGVTNAITFNVSGASTSAPAQASPWFEGGKVLWLTGNNAGYTQHIAAQVSSGGLQFVLRTQPGADIQVGDTLTATAGCDRTTADCRYKAQNSSQPNGNMVNFRGQPGLIGEDMFLTASKIKAIDDAGGRT